QVVVGWLKGEIAGVAGLVIGVLVTWAPPSERDAFARGYGAVRRRAAFRCRGVRSTACRASGERKGQRGRPHGEGVSPSPATDRRLSAPRPACAPGPARRGSAARRRETRAAAG